MTHHTENAGQSDSVPCDPEVQPNTFITIRPYADYFNMNFQKENGNAFARIVKKNWRQFFILIPGILLLCGSTSIHITWTIWQLVCHYYDGAEIRLGVLLAWYFGATIGFMAGAGLNNVWTKKSIYYFSGIVLTVSSLFYVFHLYSEYYLLFGRILAGAVHGISYIAVMQHASDNSSPQFRRFSIGFISFLLSFPIIFTTYLITPFLSIVEDPAARTHIAIGVITFAFSIVALIVMPCTKDSIVFQISSNNDLQALQCMYEIRNETRRSIRSDFNEFKLMVAQDCRDGGHLLWDGNVRPLCWILVARLLSSSLANNICITTFSMDLWKVAYFQYNTTFSSLAHEDAFPEYPLLFALLLKSFIGIGILLSFNGLVFSPNTSFYIAAFFLATFSLTTSIAMSVDFIYDDDRSIISTYLLMCLLNAINVLFVCISFGIDTFGYIQLTEGFSVAKRSWSIAVISIVETFAHVIAIVALTFPYRFYFHYVHYVVIMLLSYYLICFMPRYTLNEQVSLKKARHKFKN